MAQRIMVGLQDLSVFANAYPSRTLDLSRRELTQIPNELPDCNHLENLYLEGNRLTTLPDSFFSSCLNLKWLDLRNNQIKVLPPSIERLRNLRTLLLEGNQLMSLPVQLCRLSHLTGLNLSRNPLQDPPKEITERGTKAVLGYLREVLNGGELSSSDSSSSLPDGEGSTTYIPLKSTAQPSTMQMSPNSTNGRVALPVPNMRPVTLHAQGTHSRNQVNKKLHSRSPKPTWKKKGPYNRTEYPLPARASQKHSKDEINKSLSKLKSEHGLEEWRTQAKLKQKQQEQLVRVHGQQPYSKAADTAPFATETKASVGAIAQGSEDRVQSQLSIQRYRSRLEEKRKQVGIITKPSSQLLDAEKSLAEALAMQADLERKKAKEYRLKAFTGDSLPY